MTGNSVVYAFRMAKVTRRGDDDFEAKVGQQSRSFTSVRAAVAWIDKLDAKSAVRRRQRRARRITRENR